MDRIELVEEQINEIQKQIASDNFAKILKDGVSNTFSKQIREQINDVIEIVQKDYQNALSPVSDFVKLVIKMLHMYEEHIKLNRKIRCSIILKDKYKDFCYEKYGELNSKIELAIEQLNLIKKDELVNNVCAKNVDLFNLLNNQKYTNYYDVIDYVNDSNISPDIKNKVINKINVITSNELVSAQQIDYLIEQLYFYKALLKYKKKEAHKEIKLMNELISSLSAKDELVWPLYINNDKLSKKQKEDESSSNQAEAEQYQKGIFDIIINYISALDEVSLSLIVAFCAQLSLFEVTYIDYISGKVEKRIIEANRKAYIKYIKAWIMQFKKYLEINMGDMN